MQNPYRTDWVRASPSGLCRLLAALGVIAAIVGLLDHAATREPDAKIMDSTIREGKSR